MPCQPRAELRFFGRADVLDMFYKPGDAVPIFMSAEG